MQVGDLVKVNERCDAGALWHKVGVVVGSFSVTVHARPQKRWVRVLLNGRERLFDYSALEVVNASR